MVFESRRELEQAEASSTRSQTECTRCSWARAQRSIATTETVQRNVRPPSETKLVHDFVIPSVALALYVLPGEESPDKWPHATFLGNRINPRGSHLSGARDSARPHVVARLEELGRRLARADT